VHAVSGLDASPVRAGAWSFRSLPLAPAEGLSPSDSAPYALALSAL